MLEFSEFDVVRLLVSDMLMIRVFNCDIILD